MKEGIIFLSSISIIGMSMLATTALRQFTREEASYEETDEVDDANNELTDPVKIHRNSPKKPLKNLVHFPKNVEAENSQSFIISIPHGLNVTSGATIKLNVPMTNKSNNETMSNQISTLPSDNQNWQHVETAIMEALLIAKHMTGLDPLDKSFANGTAKFVVASTSTTTKPTASPAAPSPVGLLAPILANLLTSGPAREFIIEQFRNGNLPRILTRGMSLPVEMVVAVVQVIECTVFSYCDGI